MNRTATRRQLALEGWRYLLFMVVPVLISSQLPQLAGRFGEPLALPLFLVGLATLFLNLPRFTAYKHALIDTEKDLGSDAEASAWAALRAVRLRALRTAALPAWLAAIGAPLGLEPVAQGLLVSGSLVLLLLYRIPR
ncbi:hypothetical protein [Pseudomonas stutzeri]|uniref:MFS transporter n=1 Tax=Stutzerimonas stutzeri TaxID=316 RepID=A0A0D9ADZ7_STUST|nr:hypothetical protein UF78_18775 [Stutzerimonas stutzeri]